MAKFISKCANQVLTVIPNRKQIQDGIIIPVQGKHVRFDRGEYTTENKQEINFIRQHALYGVSITEAEETKAS